MSPDILTPLITINIITIIIDVAIVIITITITVLLTLVPVPLTILSTTLIFLLLLLLLVQPVCAAALIRQKELQPALIVRDSAAVSGVGLIWIYWTGS